MFCISVENICPFCYWNLHPLSLATENPVFIWEAKPHTPSVHLIGVRLTPSLHRPPSHALAS